MRNLLGILFMLAVIIACSDDDHTSGLHLGEWNLERSSGGIAGVDDVFEIGEVSWDFISDSQVVISNLYIGNNIYPGPVSGSFSYEIINNARGEFLSVDGLEHGELEIVNNVLTLNSNRYAVGDASDGIIFEFRR